MTSHGGRGYNVVHCFLTEIQDVHNFPTGGEKMKQRQLGSQQMPEDV